MALAVIKAGLRGANGHETTGSPVDLSPYVKSLDFTAGLDSWLNDNQPSQGTILLKNEGGECSPLKASSPLYPNLQAMRSCWVWMATGHTNGGQTELEELSADTPNLIWKLTDTSGSTAADASGNGRTGSISGGPALADMAGPGLAVGTANVMRFDGVNDLVTGTPGITSATDLWAECWVQNFGDTGVFFCVGDGGSNGFALGLGLGDAATPGYNLVVCRDGTWSDTEVLLTPGWHHVALYQGSGNAQTLVYLDGSVVKQISGGITNPTNTVMVGNRTGGGFDFDGWLYGFACGNKSGMSGTAPAISRFEAHTAVIRKAVFAGVIDSVVPNPHANVRTATMRLNDPLVWLTLDKGQPSGGGAYGTVNTSVNLNRGLDVTTWYDRMRRISGGSYNVAVAPTFSAGTTVMQQLRSLGVDNDGGRIYSDPEGSFVFEAEGFRSALDHSAPRASLNGTFIEFLPEHPATRDIKNYITATHNGGSVTAADATSISTYGRRDLAISAPFLNSTDAQARADAALARLKDPHERVQVVVNSGDPAMLRHILMRQISTRITLVNADTGINGDYYIESRAIQAQTDGFLTCTWQCTPA